jgi:hypothetical protein
MVINERLKLIYEGRLQQIRGFIIAGPGVNGQMGFGLSCCLLHKLCPTMELRNQKWLSESLFCDCGLAVGLRVTVCSRIGMVTRPGRSLNRGELRDDE